MVFGGDFLLNADQSAPIPSKEQVRANQTDIKDRHTHLDSLEPLLKVQIVHFEDIEERRNKKNDALITDEFPVRQLDTV